MTAGSVPEGWAALQVAYQTPLEAVRALAGETPLVGVLGGGAPVEIVLAAGALPVALPPQLGERPLAGRYLAPRAPVEIAGRLERLLSGELTSLALALMTSRCEIDALLYHSAKEILRRGEGQALPPLHLHVLLGDALAAAADYSRGQAQRLADRLASVTGTRVDAGRIAAAVADVNAARQQVERLQDLRLAGAVSGVAAAAVLGAGRVLPPQVYARALARALDDADLPAADPKAARLLLMSSDELFHPELHAALAEGGGEVVLEDGDWGARSLGPAIAVAAGADPLEAVVEHYRTHAPGLAVYPHTRRNAWFYAQAQRPEVEAVVFHIPLNEAPLGWDYPRLARFTEGLGKPALLLRQDPLTPAGRSEIAEAARAFFAETRLERCA